MIAIKKDIFLRSNKSIDLSNERKIKLQEEVVSELEKMS